MKTGNASLQHDLRRSGSESELSNLPVVKLLLSAGGLPLGLEGSKLAAESAGLLLSQVVGSVLLALEFVTGSGDALLTKHGQRASDRLPDGLHKLTTGIDLRGSC